MLLSTTGLLGSVGAVLLWRFPRIGLWCLTGALVVSAVATASARTRMFIFGAPADGLEGVFWRLDGLVVTDPAALPFLLLSAAVLLALATHVRPTAARAYR
jgi:hypothetical protein